MTRIALRLHFWGIVGFAALLAIALTAQLAGFVSLNDTAARRAAFGAQVAQLAPTLSILLPLPVHPETPWGYALWRGMGSWPWLLAIWAVVAGTGVMRGEEESGLIEAWLATGLSRSRLVLARLAAFTIAVLIAAGIASAAGALTGSAEGLGAPLAGLAVYTVAMALIAAAWFCLAILVSHFLPTPQAAAGTSAAVMVAAILLAGAGRTVPALSGVRWISPFAFIDRVQSVAPGGETDWWAVAVPAAFVAALAALAVAGFLRRDIGSVLWSPPRADRPPGHLPSTNPLLRSAVLEALWEQRFGLAGWATGLFLVSAALTGLGKPIVEVWGQPGKTDPRMLRIILGAGSHGSLYNGYVGAVVFSFAVLLLAAFAVQQVARWAAEDSSGRLEMVLSAPLSRPRVVEDRLFGLALSAALAAIAVVAGVLAAGTSYSLDTALLLLAGALTVPMTLAFAGLGAAVAAWRPRVAVVGVGAVAFISYFMPFLGPFVRLPEWTGNLSLFQLYGHPMIEGVYWRGLAITVALAAAGFTIALVALQRRDIGR